MKIQWSHLWKSTLKTVITICMRSFIVTHTFDVFLCAPPCMGNIFPRIIRASRWQSQDSSFMAWGWHLGWFFADYVVSMWTGIFPWSLRVSLSSFSWPEAPSLYLSVTKPRFPSRPPTKFLAPGLRTPPAPGSLAELSPLARLKPRLPGSSGWFDLR